MAEGKTKGEAVTNALRSAIEQAFGTFISSKTDIVNDNLMKDEIVSVSSGNIQKYDVLSTTALPNGNTAVTVKADVSVTKLTSFVESKGVAVELKGATFAANIKLQQLYAKNELEAVRNLETIIIEMLSTQFFYDYSITVSEPIADAYGEGWKLEHRITITPNKNMDNLTTIISNTLNALSMKDTELTDYKAKNLTFSGVSFMDGDYYLRNASSVEIINDICCAIDFIKYRCQVNNGVYIKCLYSRIIQDSQDGSKYWAMGFLTGYIPTYYYADFKGKSLFSEDGYINSGYSSCNCICDHLSLSDADSYYYKQTYGTYNINRNYIGLFIMKLPYSSDINATCLYSSERREINSLKKNNGDRPILSRNIYDRYLRFTPCKATVAYTEILPLSVLEQIKQVTVEPFKYDGTNK